MKKLKMQPAVAYIAEPRSKWHLANDASCTVFLLLPASSGYSVYALLLLRDTIVSYRAFLKPNFYIVHIKTINLHPVFSYLAAEAFRGAHTKASHI